MIQSPMANVLLSYAYVKKPPVKTKKGGGSEDFHVGEPERLHVPGSKLHEDRAS